MFAIICTCNRHIVTWSGLESSSHINLYLCALFLWVICMNFDINIINKLNREVYKAYKHDEIPVGCVIFDSNNKIIASACNNRQGKHNVLGHAEINCVIKAEKRIKDWRINGYKMLVSLEPCDMCKVILMESRIDQVYYVLPRSKKSEIVMSNCQQADLPNDYYTKLLTDFFDNKR